MQVNLEDTKGYSEDVNRRRTDNTMTKRKRRKGQTMIYKTTHRKPKAEQHERHQKSERVSTHVLRKGETVPAPHVAPVVLLWLQTR